MSSKVISVSAAIQYIGSRVSGEHKSGWGESWWFDGKLLAVVPSDNLIFLEICECIPDEKCDEELGTHGAWGFWGEDQVSVYF